MKKLSEAFRDAKETPLERGIFWIEYVLKHNGAGFLSPISRNMPVYKLMGLDIIAFVFCVSIATCILIYQILKCLCRKKTIKEKNE